MIEVFFAGFSGEDCEVGGPLEFPVVIESVVVIVTEKGQEEHAFGGAASNALNPDRKLLAIGELCSAEVEVADFKAVAIDLELSVIGVAVACHEGEGGRVGVSFETPGETADEGALSSACAKDVVVQRNEISGRAIRIDRIGEAIKMVGAGASVGEVDSDPK